jgi:hypothetical protein
MGDFNALLMMSNINQCVMKPISPQHYRGIFYIRLEALPDAQRDQFFNWLPVSDFIKLKVDEHIIDNCVNYQDYLFWFENFYSLERDYSLEL